MSRHKPATTDRHERDDAPPVAPARAGAVPLGAWLETAAQLQERMAHLGLPRARVDAASRETLAMTDRARDFDTEDDGYEPQPRTPRVRRPRPPEEPVREAVRRRSSAVSMHPDDVEDVMSAASAEAARHARRSEMKTASALDAITRWIEAAEGRRVEETRRFSSTQDKTFSTLRDALELMTGRLDDIERKMTDGRERGFEPIRGALGRLEDRIDSLETQSAATGPQNERITKALGDLEKRLGEVVVKIDELGDPRAPGRSDARISGIESKLAGLLEQLTRQTGGVREPDMPVERPRVHVREMMNDGRLTDAVREIRHRQASLDPEAGSAFRADTRAEQRAEQRSTAAVAAVVGLHHDVAELMRNLDATQRTDPRRDILALRNDVGALARAIGDIAPQRALAALDTRLDDIAGKIEASRDAGTSEQVIKPLETLLIDVARAVEAVGRNRSVDDVRAAVQDLAAKIEGLDSSETDRDALGALVAEMRAIKTAVTQSGSPQWAGALQAAMGELGQRIDTLAAGNPDVRTLTGLSRTMADVRETLAAAPSAPAFAALEQRLDGLSARIDEAVSGPIDLLGSKIDGLGSRLDQLAAGQRDDSGIAAMIDSLGNRFEELAAERRNDDALGAKIDSLDNRFEQLATRRDDGAIDDIRHRLDRLTDSIERSAEKASGEVEILLRDLATRIDSVRHDGADTGAIKGIQDQLQALSSSVGGDRAGREAASQIERLVQQMLGELAQTRVAAIDAAETAARTAAREAAREAVALATPVTSVDPAMTSTLSAMQATLERISGRLHDLEASGTVEATAVQVPVPVPAAQPPVPLEPIARALRSEAEPIDLTEPARPVRAARTSAIAKAAAVSAAAVAPAAAPVAKRDGVVAAARQAAAKMMQGIGVGAPVHAGDAPLEPGSGRPPRNAGPVEAALSAPVQSGAGGPEEAQSFIQAARRAAQTATAERRDAPARRAIPTAAATLAVPGDSRLTRARAAIEARRKPLLIGAAAIVLVFGVTEVAKIWMGDAEPTVQTGASSPLGPIVASAPRTQPANRTASDQPTPTGTIAEAPQPQPAAAPSALAPAPAARAPVATTSSFDPNRFARIEPKSEAVETSDLMAVGSVTPAPKPAPNVDVPAGLGATILRVAAAAGEPKAEFEVAARLAVGRGLPRDLAAAVRWYERAAQKGLQPAQYRVGSMYEKGLGVTRDLDAAKRWYGLAAEGGSAKAMHNLAVIAADGGGAKPDYAAAADWFRKAAERGVRDSQYNLAILIARGLGAPQDLKASWRWFQIAATQGDTDAAKKRDEVGARLTSGDLAVLRAEAAAFKPVPAGADDVEPPAGGWDAKAPQAAPALPPKSKTSRL